MSRRKLLAIHSITIGLIFFSLASVASAQRLRWTEQQANSWYAKQPWLVGANYIPATAINQLEMWQADTFDPQRIDLELGWAESLGMNCMRVFLHDLLWQQDPEGFKKRIDTYLGIAEKHHIRTLFVLFDSVWDPNPQLGKQREPIPGVHNSGWVQGPGTDALNDRSQYPRLEAYVRGVVGAFAQDQRVLGWDVWNEPIGDRKKDDSDLEKEEQDRILLYLLTKVYTWAREAGPSQPLTSGVWAGDWTGWDSLKIIPKIQVMESDVLSFHSYHNPKETEQRIAALMLYKRPILCTEYMARTKESTFFNTMPMFKKFRIAAINWGLVSGKTQTIYPWESTKKPFDHEPNPWFHDIFHTDGQPYDPKEVEFIREMTGKAQPPQADNFPESPRGSSEQAVAAGR